MHLRERRHRKFGDHHEFLPSRPRRPCRRRAGARRGPRGAARRPPVALLHGWPYSFATMLPLAEALAGDGFEVIVPSLPGFAFSEPADERVRGLRFLSRRIDRDRLLTEVMVYL